MSGTITLPKWTHVAVALLTVGATGGITWATVTERANARVDTLTVEIAHLRDELRGGLTGAGSAVAAIKAVTEAHSVHLGALAVRIDYSCCPPEIYRRYQSTPPPARPGAEHGDSAGMEEL